MCCNAISNVTKMKFDLPWINVASRKWPGDNLTKFGYNLIYTINLDGIYQMNGKRKTKFHNF